MASYLLSRDDGVDVMDHEDDKDIKYMAVEAMEKMLNGVEGLTAKDVLNFFEAVDRNEANRDMAGKSKSTIIVGNSGSSSHDDNIAMIEALTRKKA